MILTCPRCATRYLVDPHTVWSPGRTVQCEACGQRWRAFGQGERPPPEAEPAPVRPPPVASEAEPAPPTAVADPVPAAAVLEEPLSAPSMFRPPPAKRASGFAASVPSVNRLLAIACLTIIVLTATVVFRGAIVRTYPGLARVYAGVGLAVEAPAPAGPHG